MFVRVPNVLTLDEVATLREKLREAPFVDGKLTAAVHTTERGAKEAAADLLDDEEGTLEDRFARAQRLVSDEGGIMEIVASPVFGG